MILTGFKLFKTPILSQWIHAMASTLVTNTNIYGIVLFICLILHVKGCDVEIKKPYHPMYVQTGLPMKLVCRASGCSSDKSIHLRWDRQTQEVKWAKQGKTRRKLGSQFMDKPRLIDPKSHDGWITRNLYEQPSGLVESTLIRTSMTVDDHGWYICRDEKDENSFSIWVTVLQIDPSPNVTLGTSEGEDVTLTCILGGVNTNYPEIEYVWTWNNLEIVNITDRYSLLPSFEGETSLVIHKPKKRDGGTYRCYYVLATNLGPVNFSQAILVDASKLTVSGSTSIHAVIYTLLCTTFLLIVV